MVDLRECEPGDKLLTSHGLVLEYVKANSASDFYPHTIKYPDGGMGTRNDDGTVYANKRKPACDHDVIEILDPGDVKRAENTMMEVLRVYHDMYQRIKPNKARLQ
jgi:hypothetical protein